VKKLIISALGKDQAGIVSAFTKVLLENNCNLEDTSMTLLEDQFTMWFIVTAPQDITVRFLEDKLKAVTTDFNLQLVIHIVETLEESPKSAGRPWMISVSGLDHTGIVHHVTEYLAKHAINIKHLSSKRLSRPSGEVLFLMALEVDVPETITDEALEADFARLAQEEHLEIHAEPLEVYTL
jgi:glycine cleavage system transcriptional repressor